MAAGNGFFDNVASLIDSCPRLAFGVMFGVCNLVSDNPRRLAGSG